MDGIVKIGMTTREPEDRITELSNVTGVPTPFQLVYKEYFENCVYAESMIHEILEQRNSRVSNNREFFKIPVYEAIKLIQDIKTNWLELATQSKKSINMQENINQNDTTLLANDLFEKAEEYYYGLGNTLQDYHEALNLYKRATKLGSIKAFKEIGKMCKNGQGCKENLDMAIKYFKNGADLGDINCFAELGRIYLSDFDGKLNIENAKKCWNNYFNNLTEVDYLDIIYITDYILMSLRNHGEIYHLEIIYQLKDAIIEHVENMIESGTDKKDTISRFNFFSGVLEFLDPSRINFLENASTIAKIIDFFIIDGRGVVLQLEILKGFITEGEFVRLQGKSENKLIKIEAIEKNREFVEYADIGDTVGILISKNIEELDFIASGGYLINT